MRGSLAAAITTVLVLGAPAAALAHHERAVRGRLGSRPVTIRDTQLPAPHGHAIRKASLPTGATGGAYKTADGYYVNVYDSPSYGPPEPDTDQTWADYFDSLVHRGELAKVTAYFAPYSEVTAFCGSDSNACYDPTDETIWLPGDPPPDGTPVEDLAAHEYGHHIAYNRSNAPWSAYDWGTKRWASYEGVCPRVRNATAFPGDEGANYQDNPGEAYAETNRVLNGGQSTWDIVDPSWKPDQTALAEIRADILSPWTHGTTRTWTGSLVTARARHVTVNTPLDGNLLVKLTSHGSLDGDLYVFDEASGKRIAKRATTAHSETLSTRVCGPAALDVEVYRYSGEGSYSLSVTKP